VVKASTHGDACSCLQARCQSTRCARGAVPSMGNSKVWKHQLPLSCLFSSLSSSDGERRLPRHSKKCGVAKASTHGNAGSREVHRRTRAVQEEFLSSKRPLFLARGAVPSTRVQRKASRCSCWAWGQVIGSFLLPSHNPPIVCAKKHPDSRDCLQTFWLHRTHRLPCVMLSLVRKHFACCGRLSKRNDHSFLGEREHGRAQTTENVRKRKQARSQEQYGKDKLQALSEIRLWHMRARLPLPSFGPSMLVLFTIRREKGSCASLCHSVPLSLSLCLCRSLGVSLSLSLFVCFSFFFLSSLSLSPSLCPSVPLSLCPFVPL